MIYKAERQVFVCLSDDYRHLWKIFQISGLVIGGIRATSLFLLILCILVFNKLFFCFDHLVLNFILCSADIPLGLTQLSDCGSDGCQHRFVVVVGCTEGYFWGRLHSAAIRWQRLFFSFRPPAQLTNHTLMLQVPF